MNIIRGHLDGLLIVEPKVFGDARGFFLETWNQRRYAEAGIEVNFVQDNLSRSVQGTLRGLHCQNPNPQGKLVSVLEGVVLDVVADIRAGSPTFGKWQSVLVSAENKRQVYVPPGLAHGFLVLSDTALFQYKCTDFYAPANELTIRWDDPNLAIAWPLPADAPILRSEALSAGEGNTDIGGPLPEEWMKRGLVEPILSAKDARAPRLCEVPPERLVRYVPPRSDRPSLNIPAECLR